MGFAEVIDRAVAVFSPQSALKRTAARKKMQILNSGYGNYGASTTKKSLTGWLFAGGSHREDIEDNVSVLRQRSRDLYMGVPVANGAVKTMRTNVVGRGLYPKPTIDREIINMSPSQANKLEKKIQREWRLWAEKPDCNMARIDNFYELQQLAFLNWLLSGDCLHGKQGRTGRSMENVSDVQGMACGGFLPADLRGMASESLERAEKLLAGIPKGAEWAFANAMNRGLSHVKTQAFREVKQVYAVKQSALSEATTTRISRASTGNLAGYVSFSGVKIPLASFLFANLSAGEKVKKGDDVGVVLAPATYTAASGTAQDGTVYYELDGGESMLLSLKSWHRLQRVPCI